MKLFRRAQSRYVDTEIASKGGWWRTSYRDGNKCLQLHIDSDKHTYSMELTPVEAKELMLLIAKDLMEPTP